MKTTKPYVICHMMTTIDGKIASGVEGVDILDDFFPTYTETEDQLHGQAWMCGRVTMEMFASKSKQNLSTPSITPVIENFIAGVDAKTYLVGVDTKGLLRWDGNSVQLTNVPSPSHLIIVVTEETPKEYLSYLREKNISYIFGGVSELDFDRVFHTLNTSLGVERLLLEGGGILNGSVIANDLIDEMSLLLCPLIANYSPAPSVFEHQGTLNLKKFTLNSVSQQKDGSVWLRYKKQ